MRVKNSKKFVSLLFAISGREAACVRMKKPRPARISLAERGNIKGENDDGKLMEGRCLPREDQKIFRVGNRSPRLVSYRFLTSITRSNSGDGSGYRKRLLHT